MFEITTYTFGVIEHGEIEGFRNVIIKQTDTEMKTYLVHYPRGVDMETHIPGEVYVEEIDEAVLGMGRTKSRCYIMIFTCLWCHEQSCTLNQGWMLQEVTCSDDPGGGGGGNGGDDDPWGGGDDGQGDLPTDPTPGGGGGSGDGNNNDQTPCQSLRNKLNEPLVNDKSFKTRIDTLKTKYDNPGGYEYGFVNQNPKDEGGTNTQTNQYNPTVSTAPHKTKSPFLSKRQTFGYAHTHPVAETSAGIHSFPDLKIFIEMVLRRFNAGLSTDDTYGMVVGEHGVYSLKMNNITTFASFFLGATNQEKKQFWNDFEIQYDILITYGTDNTRAGNEEAMAKLLKKFDDKLGIGLYRAKDDLTGWNHLTLGVHGSGVLSTPCN